MINTIIEFLRNILREENTFSTLEQYVIEGNPQDADDIDRLEREYWEKIRKSNFFNRCI